MLRSLLSSAIRTTRHVLYPSVCFTCDSVLSEPEERICSRCWQSFTQLRQEDLTWIQMSERFSRAGVVDDFVSCYLFEKEGPLQDVIHKLKYSGMKSLGLQLGADIGARIASHPKLSSADMLVPVPLHRTKQRERGYNQCEYLCRGITRVSAIPYATGLLCRAKYTETQTQLNLEDRRANVGDAFALRPHAGYAIKGMKLIIIDDVITTGSTISACAVELKTNGAEAVYAASVALAQ